MPRHDKTNVMRLPPAVWLRSMLFAIQTLLQEENLIANSMDPDQTARTYTVYCDMYNMRYKINFFEASYSKEHPIK
jgi:hypothetical protein